MESATFDVSGMRCGGCVRHVEDALRRVPGVAVRQVTVGTADVSFDLAKTTSAAIVAAIGAAGYAARERPAASVADRLACRTELGHRGCCCG